MDSQTHAAYEQRAAEMAAYHRSLVPARLYQLALTYFEQGAPTADIGAGSGRDTHWLNEQGFPTAGYDASPAMVAEARAAYGTADFAEAQLPTLASLPDGAFQNVLCSAVLMHLPAADLITAATNLARVLRPRGRLLLSYRAARGPSEREEDGRLYTDIPPGKLTLLLESVGLRVLLHETQSDPQRAEIQWHTLVAERGGPVDVARGLQRVQAVLAQDRKTATYKLALIRALCHASREAGSVQWGIDEVYVSLRSLAERWLRFYWPLLTGPHFIAQLNGESPTSAKSVAFRPTLVALAQAYSHDGLFALLHDLAQQPRRFQPALRRIANTIRRGPVTYSGTHGPPLFEYIGEGTIASGDPLGAFGWVVVPTSIWLDLCRFDHWIEDSVIVRWAQLSEEMNRGAGRGAGFYLSRLLQPAADPRTTGQVRHLVASGAAPSECVWSGAPLRHKFEVDHLLPYSVWGNNDLWNLLPCTPTINRQKRDQLPSATLLHERQPTIVAYWERYRTTFPTQFDQQLHRAFGATPGATDWQPDAFAALLETTERLATTRGLARWTP